MALHDPDLYLSRYPDPTQWTVTMCRYDRRHVFLRPDGSVSLPRWISGLRQCLPVLQERSPAELLATVRCSGGIDLGIISGSEAYNMRDLLRVSASLLDVADASSTSYFAEVDGSGLIIEDAAENDAFCLQLIERGAKVGMIETD